MEKQLGEEFQKELEGTVEKSIQEDIADLLRWFETSDYTIIDVFRIAKNCVSLARAYTDIEDNGLLGHPEYHLELELRENDYTIGKKETINHKNLQELEYNPTEVLDKMLFICEKYGFPGPDHADKKQNRFTVSDWLAETLRKNMNLSSEKLKELDENYGYHWD
jgi:hypothetical protein